MTQKNKHSKNKFELKFYDDDRRYAIVVYLAYILITLCMVLFQNKYYTMVQGPFLTIHNTLTGILIITILISTICCIFRKSMIELITLIIGISAISLLLLEKTYVFFIAPLDLSFGVYIDYVSVTLFKLIFIIYRFLKVNRIIKANKEYIEILKEQNINLNDGEVRS